MSASALIFPQREPKISRKEWADYATAQSQPTTTSGFFRLIGMGRVLLDPSCNKLLLGITGAAYAQSGAGGAAGVSAGIGIGRDSGSIAGQAGSKMSGMSKALPSLGQDAPMREQSVIWVGQLPDSRLFARIKKFARAAWNNLDTEPAYRFSLIRKPRIVHGSFLSREDCVPDSCSADNSQCRPD